MFLFKTVYKEHNNDTLTHRKDLRTNEIYLIYLKQKRRLTKYNVTFLYNQLIIAPYQTPLYM